MSQINAMVFGGRDFVAQHNRSYYLKNDITTFCHEIGMCAMLIIIILLGWKSEFLSPNVKEFF